MGRGNCRAGSGQGADVNNLRLEDSRLDDRDGVRGSWQQLALSAYS